MTVCEIKDDQDNLYPNLSLINLSFHGHCLASWLWLITCGVLSVSEGELESLESNETSWLVNADVPEDRELSQ